jgi:hypothetical protein
MLQSKFQWEILNYGSPKTVRTARGSRLPRDHCTARVIDATDETPTTLTLTCLRTA